jgi:hypothetical protein
MSAFSCTMLASSLTTPVLKIPKAPNAEAIAQSSFVPELQAK